MLRPSVRLCQKLTSLQHTSTVKIVEVGPRDGLQNEPVHVPTKVKIELINKLSESGLKSIEATSFVSPKWVPQMGDNVEVFTNIKKNPSVSYPVLVPNLKVGAEEIAVFASASDGFARKNTNCTAQESLDRIKTIMEKSKDLKVRGYVSCVVGCPYDGAIKSAAVTKMCESLFDFGCYEISLGDTIGVGTTQTFENLFKDLIKLTSAKKFAIHCHDTYGQALVNICTALDFGVTVVDSSVSGLGGCPYAAGATGNVATEDLIYMLHGMGVETGVDLRKIVEAGHFISEMINKPTASRVNKALYKKYF